MGAVSHSGNIFANLMVRCSNLLKLGPPIPLKFYFKNPFCNNCHIA